MLCYEDASICVVFDLYFRIKISSVSAFINGFTFHTSSLNLNCGEKFFLNPIFSVVFSP